MRKKFGFTLAEVLITLGIIGVIAALTIPALVSNGGNEANAAKLGVVVSTLENGFSSMMTKEAVDNLFETQAWKTGGASFMAGQFGQYINTVGFKTISTTEFSRLGYTNTNTYAMTANGDKDTNTHVQTLFLGENLGKLNQVATNRMYLQLKNGALIVFKGVSNSNPTQDDITKIHNHGGSLTNVAAQVVVDVNGAQSPNIVGRDIFAFYLGSDGTLYPYGGRDVSVYDSDGHDNSLMWNSVKGTRSCLDGSISDRGLGCTARVIEEGFKINY